MTEAPKYPGLSYQPDAGQPANQVVQLLRKFLRAQFGQPSGFWGELIGRSMARAESNLSRIMWTLSLLDVQPDDRVLEVGFGPGVSIQVASRIASRGFVAGIDHSEVMLRQAMRRSRAAIRQGRVDLRLASASEVPDYDQRFDKIFSINSIHFWEDPVGSLKQLRGLLKPEGVLAITIQPRSRNATNDTTQVIGQELVAQLERAGFSQCRLEILPLEPASVACVLGKNATT
jgi:SAM-dependent methyltransferase